jgi:hypothetical protein
LKKAVTGLAPNITRGEIVVDLIPYADSVIYDKVQLGLDNVNVTLDMVDQLYDAAPDLKDSNPSQYE